MGGGVKRVLDAYIRKVASGAVHLDGIIAGAEAVADRPWDVVHIAGRLARCVYAVADEDMGLTSTLSKVAVDSRNAIARLSAGQPYPQNDHVGRRSRGAFDTPADLARRVAAAAIDACDTPTQVGIDHECGTGAFLVAMLEAGIPEVFGTDLDENALAVAQVAAPRARVVVGDALCQGPQVDIVCGNPPFVPPERQDKRLRAELRRRFPWLRGRFDLVVPFAATAAERVRPGGGLGLVLPSAALVQNYGAVLRRRWVQRHRVTEISGPHPFKGASVDVVLLVMQMDRGPAPLPAFGIEPEELMRLDNCPFNPDLMPGDVEIVEAIRRRSVPLRSMAIVDTGLVAHGPDGGKARLLHDEPGEDRKPYADAREFFAGTRRWIDYQPERMHRAKTPSLFEKPKVVVQRLRGKGAVRAAIDLDGVYVGHTCTVVQPLEDAIPIDRILQLVRSPLVDALTRIEHGQRLDLYPRDVGGFPVPNAWIDNPDVPLAEAYGLDDAALERLVRLAAR
jgi:hypothetical protein